MNTIQYVGKEFIFFSKQICLFVFFYIFLYRLRWNFVMKNNFFPFLNYVLWVPLCWETNHKEIAASVIKCIKGCYDLLQLVFPLAYFLEIGWWLLKWEGWGVYFWKFELVSRVKCHQSLLSETFSHFPHFFYLSKPAYFDDGRNIQKMLPRNRIVQGMVINKAYRKSVYR